MESRSKRRAIAPGACAKKTASIVGSAYAGKSVYWADF
ncbi:hypothetical protein BSS2_I2068 [Brucella suis bv. 1 str. S2]|uniref:Uncharacterized protein n=2 Tax=Brucella TaxID=234 RepID=Q57AC9_BRUAB|nr:hypothetical protein BR2134 [Brucella suis 1330]AAX75405.1 hypothetical protein BruAb1_2109 [Brucella abortus bv. 1 str. 9-941]AEU07111.1 hypothetical protein BSVBI22_A2130 [Brucella suis VBI22]AHN47715.1 hypothetical protein BSS2_I2068 [Brucella suis bv. 1 str. S2]CDL77505.1 unnamed protein product [Brucella canis str. Oliveri]